MMAGLFLAAAATAAAAASPWTSKDAAAIGRLLDQPAAACRSDEVIVSGGRASSAKFYDGMLGFAREAGTSGGLGRSAFVVTRTDDSPDGSTRGTLRWAVTGAAAAGGGWIAFAPHLRERTIALAAPLRLGSNLTIDGGCAMPRLIGTGRGSLFYLRGSRNVVLARLRLEQSGGGEDGDCVTVSHGADRVWLAFLRLRKCRDGLIDVTRNGVFGPMRITISNSRFSEHDKAMLVVGSPLSPPCRLSSSPIRLTVASSLFYRTGQRHPRVSGDAFVHLRDTVIAFEPRSRANGGTGGAYGTLAVEGAHVVVERTLYAPPAGGRSYRLSATATEPPPGGGAGCREGRIEFREAGVQRDAQGPAEFARSVIRATDSGSR